jgi:restriction endonuclease Mrr
MENLPYEIKDQIIQCIGRSFHFKDTVESFFRSCGVSRELANKYRDEAKFVWARKVLNDLEESDSGKITQRKILTELCKLRNVPDEVPDRNAGLEALRKLKELANSNQIQYEEQKKDSTSRAEAVKSKTKIIEERNNKLSNLRTSFFAGITSENRQKSGYDLEDILKELFALSEIDYKKSYRTDTQQIDGHFKFDGFNYLLEAKWRKDQPNESEIGGFKRKVDTKLDSTRGFFISVNGFREEVIKEFNGHGANIILMSGEDLMHILEGRIDLRDAIHLKIEKASQYGIVYAKVV